MDTILFEKSRNYMEKLCRQIGDRSVGSDGNRKATSFFAREISSLGWKTDIAEMDVIDWEDEGASIRIDNKGFTVQASPYSKGCKVKGKLVSADSIAELKRVKAKRNILLLHGDIASEQLMPKKICFLQSGTPSENHCFTGEKTTFGNNISNR